VWLKAAPGGSLNARLKAVHHRCTVEQRKASLVLRAILVGRADSSSRRRQRIPLNLPAAFASLTEAKAKAIELAHQLRIGPFAWELWEASQPTAVITVADVRAAAERRHAALDSPEPPDHERSDQCLSQLSVPRPAAARTARPSAFQGLALTGLSICHRI